MIALITKSFKNVGALFFRHPSWRVRIPMYGSDDQEGRHEDRRRKQLHQQIVYNCYDLVKALAITSISDTVTFCKEDDSVQSKFSLSFQIGNKGSKVICTLYPCNVV